jgi:organic radical activating enzyme
MKVERLYLEVTRKCTLKCEHCLKGDQENKDMSFETIENALKDVTEIDQLFFEGGEPLLAIDQILETIQLIKTKGIKVHNIRIISNGTVLNRKVVNALAKLSSVAPLSLSLSSDVFHAVELARLDLLKNWFKNNETFQEKFGSDILQWSDADDSCLRIGEDNFICILETGRAKSLTKQRIRELNGFLNEHFHIVVFDPRIVYRDKIVPSYQPDTNEVLGDIYVDVNGNVVPWNMSYAEEDEEPSKYSSNINEIGLLNAILHYRDYYTEYFDGIEESQLDELEALIRQRIFDKETRRI